MRWLRRLLGDVPEEDRLVRIAEMLSEPEARMWEEALRNEGIPAVARSPTAQASPGYSWVDFSIWTKASDAERARSIIEGGRRSRKRPR